jgi:methylphosphotriester-DNA--protein-cysteine methyltransferase
MPRKLDITRDAAVSLLLLKDSMLEARVLKVGVCMGEWLSEQRLQRAAGLLANSYLSIKEITHAVGYEHTSSFVRAFERRFLQAPARYRKHSQNQNKYAPDTGKRIEAA